MQTASSVLAAKNIPTSSPLTIVYGRESAAQAGDIVIRTDSSATGHRGGYVLDISAGGISITADDAEGVLYALTTLAQTCTSGTVLKCTTVTDWPDVAERSVYLGLRTHLFRSRDAQGTYPHHGMEQDERALS